MNGLHRLGVVELLAGYRARSFDPVDVVDACLARIDDVDHALGAVVTTAAGRARSEAEASARRWQRGRARGLDGVPFGVKDVIATAGVRTTAGWSRLADWVPDADATAVARLRGAGAVMVAKLATPELAFGDARDGHRPINPWAPEHWTGGSSSGPAVALAARLVPLALGTDTGGSIRVPASYCGVAGLKPTFGRVPRDGAVMVSWTLDHTGPMARSARDLGLALSVLAGRSAADPASADHSVDDLRPTAAGGVAAGGTAAEVEAMTDARGPCARGPLLPRPHADGRAVRVGVPRRWFHEAASLEVLAATDAAVAVLAGLGADTADVDVPDPELGGVAAWTITVAEFAALHPDWRERVADYTPAAAERLAAGAALSAGDYLRAVRVRADLRARAAELFDDVDVLVTPATPTPAPRIVPPPEAERTRGRGPSGPPLEAASAGDMSPMFGDGDRMWLESVARNLIVWNLLGLPAVVVPAGHTDDGRPLAVQVVGPPFAERRVLEVAAAYQAATTHHDKEPEGTERRSRVSEAGGGLEMGREPERATTA